MVDWFPSKQNFEWWIFSLSENGRKIAPGEARRSSSSTSPPVESIVLKKVASLTLDRAKIEKKIVKPNFVPEKLDFKIYEKFEGNFVFP